MKVLVVGGGGREHALCWKIARSNIVDRLCCAPGNAGIASVADCVDIPADEIERLLEFARREAIDLTVVGPEAPLVAGIVDRFREKGLRIFGPPAKGAQLEGSKAFCKSLLRRHGIPTAAFRVFESHDQASRHLKGCSYPVVLKADGLAAGKGVAVCGGQDEAQAFLKSAMQDGVLGDAGRRLLIEEHLTGVEGSIVAITDGTALFLLDNAQDHKRIYEGEIGPNTGGMGAYSPVPLISKQDAYRVVSKILVPTLYALRKEEIPFSGVLYAGIMFTKTGPKILEFNVRFGDPETQPVLARLKSDLVPILLAASEGKLDGIDDSQIEWDPRSAVTVVMASSGYPGKAQTGFQIQGLEDAAALPDALVFHAGTRRERDTFVTAGGRVLGVTGLGDDLETARKRAYEACRKISFKGAYFRNDIGLRGVQAARAVP